MRIIPILCPSDLGRSDRGNPTSTGLRGAPDVLLDLLEEQGVRFGRPVALTVPVLGEPDDEFSPLKFDELLKTAALQLASAVADINADANFPLILGGDHTAMFGHLLGHSERHPQGIGLAVLADPSGDLGFPGRPVYEDRKRLGSDPEVTETGNAASMVLAGVLRHFPAGSAMAECLKASALDPSHTSVVGLRGLETAQLKSLERKLPIELWRMERLELDGEQAYRSMLERHLAKGPIALSIDVRGIDPGLLAAVNQPVPDGLDWSFIKRSLEQCLPHVDRILGLDICEFDPSEDTVHSVGQVRLAETIAPFLRKITR
ncbi:MAG: arginase family protein [Myxococcales bacterium]|nr:arginase family protein [Myxococcales bacterium]